MIITKLIGGLGNQMFQYAAGRQFAHKLGVELKLDISGFDHYNLRKYELSIFNIREKFATHEEIAELTNPKKSMFERFNSWLFHKPYESLPTHIIEKFNSTIINLSDGVYLDGYWQSEKYFVDIEKIIRNEFVAIYPQEGLNLELANQIKSCNSISLHIRRGDYVSNPKTNKIHGTCDVDYYMRCIQHITKTVKSPHFFVFSDDIEWARLSLKLPYPIIFIDNNGPEKNYEDLRLMSLCKHNIIANSSFSWWGAWLNPNLEKIIIAPKKWFRDTSINTSDLIPENWTQI